ncbi:MAG: HAD-IA family hydrolase [Chitinispirillia bacterium]|jgi:HAD superfamily hydrolase (TIGR01509 family)
MKKFILFDHDGVLVDTEHWYYMANKKALSELGIKLDLKMYLKNMSKGISCWDSVRASGTDELTIIQKREKRNQYYQDYVIKENIEIIGVEDLLKELSKDYKMAIVSTAKQKDFDVIHKTRNIVQYMEFVLTREDYENAKPNPEPYLKGLEKFGAIKKETLIVEDSERGLKSAVAAGIDCVIVFSDQR